MVIKRSAVSPRPAARPGGKKGEGRGEKAAPPCRPKPRLAPCPSEDKALPSFVTPVCAVFALLEGPALERLNPVASPLRASYRCSSVIIGGCFHRFNRQLQGRCCDGVANGIAVAGELNSFARHTRRAGKGDVRCADGFWGSTANRACDAGFGQAKFAPLTLRIPVAMARAASALTAP